MPKIRPYAAPDWDEFLRLDLETGAAGFAPGDLESRRLLAERWPGLLKSRYGWSEAGPTVAASRLMVLEADDGSYAGHLWTTEQEDFFTGEVRLFITTIALVERFRGRGWAHLLMQHAVEQARARGLKHIGLGVEAANAGAVRLYEKYGFKTVRLAMEAAVSPAPPPGDHQDRG